MDLGHATDSLGGWAKFTGALAALATALRGFFFLRSDRDAPSRIDRNLLVLMEDAQTQARRQERMEEKLEDMDRKLDRLVEHVHINDHRIEILEKDDRRSSGLHL